MTKMKKIMRHGSLFSGIGGFDLAAQWMGWTNVFHCEWEDFPRKVLKHHFPKSISYGDIKETDFTIHRDKSTSSQEDSPANHTPSQAREKVKTTIDTSGGNATSNTRN